MLVLGELVVTFHCGAVMGVMGVHPVAKLGAAGADGNVAGPTGAI